MDEATSLKKRKREESAGGGTLKRKQKKPKTFLSAETARDSSPPPETNGHVLPAEPVAAADAAPRKKTKEKKEKKQKAAAPLDAGAAAPEGTPVPLPTPSATEKPKKSKKPKRKDEEAADVPQGGQTEHSVNGAAAEDTQAATEPAKPKKKKKKRSKESGDTQNGVVEEVNGHQEDGEKRKKKKKRREREDVQEDQVAAQTHPLQATSVADAMVLASSPPPRPIPSTLPVKKRTVPEETPNFEVPSKDQSPIFEQTQCIWIAVRPEGFSEPLQWVKDNYLEPKLNRFDETFKGMLLSYDNVCLNDRPDRQGAATTNQSAVNMVTLNEYAVGFCWLIADLVLFVPKRGAHLLGDIISQSVGHIGVSCWGMFNASIEAKRLPTGWRFDPDAMPKPLGAPGSEHQSLTPGSWIDPSGERVSGCIRFRIVNFDVGLKGDHAILCIEGTMLGHKREAKLREAELIELRAGKTSRQLPEFGVTDLGLDESVVAKRRW